jgi:hypothetical protein
MKDTEWMVKLATGHKIGTHDFKDENPIPGHRFVVNKPNDLFGKNGFYEVEKESHGVIVAKQIYV